MSQLRDAESSVTFIGAGRPMKRITSHVWSAALLVAACLTVFFAFKQYIQDGRIDFWDLALRALLGFAVGALAVLVRNIFAQARARSQRSGTPLDPSGR